MKLQYKVEAVFRVGSAITHMKRIYPTMDLAYNHRDRLRADHISNKILLEHVIVKLV